MSDSSNGSANNGVGFASLLGLLFIGLKLGGAIDWPWKWVLSPFWIPIAFIALLFVVFGVPLLIVRAVRASRQRNSFAEAVRKAPRDRRPQDRLR